MLLLFVDRAFVSEVFGKSRNIRMKVGCAPHPRSVRGMHFARRCQSDGVLHFLRVAMLITMQFALVRRGRRLLCLLCCRCYVACAYVVLGIISQQQTSIALVHNIYHSQTRFAGCFRVHRAGGCGSVYLKAEALRLPDRSSNASIREEGSVLACVPGRRRFVRRRHDCF